MKRTQEKEMDGREQWRTEMKGSKRELDREKEKREK